MRRGDDEVNNLLELTSKLVEPRRTCQYYTLLHPSNSAPASIFLPWQTKANRVTLAVTQPARSGARADAGAAQRRVVGADPGIGPTPTCAPSAPMPSGGDEAAAHLRTQSSLSEPPEELDVEGERARAEDEDVPVDVSGAGP